MMYLAANILSPSARRLFGAIRHVNTTCMQLQGPAESHQGHYTPITKQLWIERIASASRHQANVIESPITSKSPELTTVTYPFSSDGRLKELYRNPWNFIRIGCILEDLDSLSANIAFQHCSRPGLPLPLLVTASVDEIQLLRPISIDADATVTGRVVWTGASSLDIQMQLWQKGASGDDETRSKNEPSLVALFSFVHLDAATKRPSPVVPLTPVTDRDRALAAERQALADARRLARKQRDLNPQTHKWAGLNAQQLSSAVAPQLREARNLIELPSLAASDAVLMPSSALANAFITQPQQQNMHGRVFGGFLMRRAYELAFATTYLFAGARPSFVMVDEVSFKKPVDIGDLLRLKSRVLYTSAISESEGLLFVEVEASVTKPERLEIANTNTFKFVFAARNMSRPIKRVLPTTEEEAFRSFECFQAASKIITGFKS